MELPVVLKRNSIIRKSFALLKKIPRSYARIVANSEEYINSPPFLVNSFPKSGTHLLLQIIESFPQTVNSDSFIASTPSITWRERTRRNHLYLLRNIAPREIVTAHLFFDEEYERVLESMYSVHFFIYRDLRDVAISEAHYLTFMNKWHHMHPYYKKLPDMNSRISLAINGIDNEAKGIDYPNIANRFKRYFGWLEVENVCPIKFEDLVGENRQKTIEQIIRFYARHLTHKVDIPDLINKALANITPEKSHTFRKGEINQWKNVFTDDHKQQMDKVAGDLMQKLGFYVSD